MTPTRAEYQKKRADAGRRSRQQSRAGRDIGPIPAVVDSARKARGRASFREFCEAYFPGRFTLAWSPDHLRVIDAIERAVRDGELFALAMPRGSGKTTLCECAVLWSLLRGDHAFVVLIGSSEDHANRMLANLKTELSQNDDLFADYPEAMFPIRALEGEARRCTGQLHHGKPTHIEWRADGLTLPTIPGSRSSGACVRVAGITGNIRGAVHTKPDGTRVRPSLVIIDDPQTDQSARSPAQCAERERILSGAILGLAGPDARLAGLMTLTVVQPDDLADRILDRDRSPQWQGERCQLVYDWPTNERLWQEYAKIRAASLRRGQGLDEATEFYRANREAMDAGARVAWPERFRPGELSAIQHAYNLRLTDEAAFWAEYQNRPQTNATELDDLTANDIVRRLNGHERGIVPVATTRLTAFVDVHKEVLFWLVAGWTEDFGGAVVAYGTEPEQGRDYFTLRDIRRTLSAAAPSAGPEGAITAGLDRLAERVLGREWSRDDGSVCRIDRTLVDAGYSADVIRAWCRATPLKASPSFGIGIGASSRPMDDRRPGAGEIVGPGWRSPAPKGKPTRQVNFDANHWKSFVRSRLTTAMGDTGALTLFGRDPEDHRLFADHLLNEHAVRVEAKGRVVDEWKQRMRSDDNHWLDCLVGAAVAASIEGATLPATRLGPHTQHRKRPRSRLSSVLPRSTR